MPGLPATVRADRPSPSELTSKIDQYMAACVGRDQFSGAILLARNGGLLFSRGYGMANLELDVPCAPKTKFRLGSITKQFTAMAILILQERGKLAVTDPIKKYLPSAPKTWDDITIQHLLTHTSGIMNYTDLPDFLKTLRNAVTLDELIAKFKDKPLGSKPGEKFKYSNSGYIVLGQIIEAASGRPYAKFMQEAIFDPLEMHDTGYDNATGILKNRASGYSRVFGLAPVNALYIDMSIPHAAGALYSTVDDLLKWDRALDSDKLVSRKSLGAMFTPFKDGYGYGWSIGRKFDQTLYSHAGGIPGFVTFIERYPDEKLLVVVLSNLEGSRVDRIGNDLAAIAFDGPYVIPREPKPATVDLALYDTYAGQYQMDRPGSKEKILLTVTKVDKRLMVERKGQPRLPAIPESETRFYLKGPDATVEFVKGAKGAVTHLVLLQDNRYMKAQRIESGAAPEKPPQATPKPAETPAKPAEAVPSVVPGARP
jgi:CubicO group peptidase (beta-lactamase class C family)